MSSRLLTRKVLIRTLTSIFMLILGEILVGGLAYSQNTVSVSPKDSFLMGNRHYASGDYDKAISEYQSILKQGLKSGNLYYNLGNCYLKKGEIGMAILSYERARFFIPRDSALLANHRYAKSLMKQKDLNPGGTFLLRILYGYFGLMTMPEAIFAFGALYYAFTLFLILSIFRKKDRLLFRLFALLLLIVSAMAGDPLINKIIEAEKRAIVIASITDAKLEPAEDAPSNFPLYEGMEMRILKKNKDWYKVKRPDNKIGWISVPSAERVID